MAHEAGPILVVDPDHSTRAFIRALLESAGLCVVDAATGERALTLGRKRRPRLALVDVFLPGLSGYEVCHRLKTELGIPVVILSRSARESLDEVAGLLLGADACLAKPFAPDDLLDKVRQLLDRHPAAA
jgi:two-component system, OmpR family, alkaline phosphatase synthesis response regulator PhoP